MHGESVELAGQTDGKVTDVNHLLDLAQSFLQALSHFVRHEGSERILVLPQGFAVEADDFSALWCWHVTPGLTGFGRCSNDLFVIIG